jgi:hypothetical protein
MDMKKLNNLLLLFFTLAFSIVSPAQEPDGSVKLFTIYPGYIVTNSGDTLKGYLMLKNKISNQGKVFFFKTPDSKDPVKYKPNDIKAYKVADRIYECMKYSPEYTTMRYCFLLRTTDGAINIYKAYYDDKKRIKIDEKDIWNSKIDFSFSESELKEQILGCRKGEELQNFGSLEYLMKFKKKMSEYLSDCTEIAKKIANKEVGYVYGNLEKIIAEYNSWYLKNHKN